MKGSFRTWQQMADAGILAPTKSREQGLGGTGQLEPWPFNLRGWEPPSRPCSQAPGLGSTVRAQNPARPQWAERGRGRGGCPLPLYLL